VAGCWVACPKLGAPQAEADKGGENPHATTGYAAWRRHYVGDYSVVANCVYA